MTVLELVTDDSPLDGEEVTNAICDLIERMLPRVPTGDPVRERLETLLPALQDALGRLTPRRT